MVKAIKNVIKYAKNVCNISEFLIRSQNLMGVRMYFNAHYPCDYQDFSYNYEIFCLIHDIVGYEFEIENSIYSFFSVINSLCSCAALFFFCNLQSGGKTRQLFVYSVSSAFNKYELLDYIDGGSTSLEI